MEMRLPCSSCLVLLRVGSATTSGFTIGIRLVLQDCDQLPHVPPNSKSRFQRSSLFRLRIRRQHHHCCIVAHDVLSRSRDETEPTTVQPLHSKFLQRPCCLFHAVPTWNVVNVHAACLTSHVKHLPESVLEWFELLAQCCRCRCCLRLDSLRTRFWLGCVRARFVFNVNDARLLVAL